MVCSVTSGDWQKTHDRVSGRDSYLLLDDGILLLNARVRGSTFLSIKAAFRECVLQTACVIEMLSGGREEERRTVPIISLGLEAETMSSMIKSSLDSSGAGVRLTVHKSSHPARIARDRGTSPTSVLDNKATSLKLASVVSYSTVRAGQGYMASRRLQRKQDIATQQETDSGTHLRPHQAIRQSREDLSGVTGTDCRGSGQYTHCHTRK